MHCQARCGISALRFFFFNFSKKFEKKCFTFFTPKFFNFISEKKVKMFFLFFFQKENLKKEKKTHFVTFCHSSAMRVLPSREKMSRVVQVTTIRNWNVRILTIVYLAKCDFIVLNIAVADCQSSFLSDNSSGFAFQVKCSHLGSKICISDNKSLHWSSG